MAAKLIFFGNERIATGIKTSAPTLRALIDAGYEIAALVIAQNVTGKSRKQRELEIVNVAEEHDIPVLSPTKLSEAKDTLAGYKADAGVLIAYGKLVPPEIIEMFPRGIINVHPSLLPIHRGPTPIESAIKNADSKTGVSLMQLVKEMDAGPVFAQRTVELKGNETKQALADTLLNLGKDMLLEALPNILDGSLQPEEQDDEKAVYDTRLRKEEGELDFQKPAEELAREVRAFAGWPRSWAKIGTGEVIVTEAHVSDENGVAGTLWIAGKQLGIYGSEGVLVIDKLIPSGKKEMPTSAFLAGYKPN